MQILESAPQGSAAWHAARATRFCASEAAAAMGLSKYTTRTELLKQKKTGLTEEVSPAKQRLFDAGHQAEHDAGPIAERIAALEFYPAVGTAEIEGLPLLASFDGIDMMEEVIWENKLLNQSLAEKVKVGDLEPHYWAQLEHQLLVSNAKKALFTTSDGTPDGTFHLWYESAPARRQQVIDAWKQFAIDLAAYVPAEVVAPVVAAPVESLPAVSVRMNGTLAVVSNLDLFGVKLRAFVEKIDMQPSTDQAFADAESAVKALGNAEDALQQAEAAALAQTASVEEMRRTVADYVKLARNTRLLLEKVVKSRKEQIRLEIVQDGTKALADHVEALNVRLGKPYMPPVIADFADAIKGKKNIDSLRNAVNTTLANSKISANAVADHIQINLNVLRDLAADHKFLFSDVAQIVLKEVDDLATLVQFRIAEHDRREAAKAETLREKLRQEELARIEREQAEAARMAAAQAETEQMAAKNTVKEPPAFIEQAQAAIETVAHFTPAPVLGIVQHIPASSLQPAANTEQHQIKLGDINARIAPLSISADGLLQLGFAALPVKGSARLYLQSDLPRMLKAMVAQLNNDRQLLAA